MDFGKIYEQLNDLLTLVKGWEKMAQQDIPSIEHDLMLEKLRKLYEQIRFAKCGDGSQNQTAEKQAFVEGETSDEEPLSINFSLGNILAIDPAETIESLGEDASDEENLDVKLGEEASDEEVDAVQELRTESSVTTDAGASDEILGEEASFEVVCSHEDQSLVSSTQSNVEKQDEVVEVEASAEEQPAEEAISEETTAEEQTLTAPESLETTGSTTNEADQMLQAEDAMQEKESMEEVVNEGQQEDVAREDTSLQSDEIASVDEVEDAETLADENAVADEDAVADEELQIEESQIEETTEASQTQEDVSEVASETTEASQATEMSEEQDNASEEDEELVFEEHDIEPLQDPVSEEVAVDDVSFREDLAEDDIFEVVTLDASSSDPKKESQTSVATNLFGVEEPISEEEERRKRHQQKQRMIMSLYEDDTPRKEDDKDLFEQQTTTPFDDDFEVCTVDHVAVAPEGSPLVTSVNVAEDLSQDEEPNEEELFTELSVEDLHTSDEADPHGEQMPAHPLFEQQTMPQQAPTGAVLGEVINHEVQTLGDSFQRPQDDVATLIRKNESGADLEKGIEINDKFLLISDLFDGDVGAYNRTIHILNRFDNMDDCLIYITEHYAWNPNSEGVKLLMGLLNRKFE